MVILLELMKPDPNLEEQEVGQNSSTTYIINLVKIARVPGNCVGIGKGKVTNCSYRKVWLLGTCAYIFWRNVLLNLPYLLSTCTYREYC